MDEYANCPKCGYKTKLDHKLEIFESGDNSELICIGKCSICKSTVKKRYPLTKGDPTWAKSYTPKIIVSWKKIMKALNALYVDII